MTDEHKMTKNGAHTVLDERYQLLQCLRHDERVQVWLSTHLFLDRKVIVKLLPLPHQYAPALSAISREIRPVVRLDHPHILYIENFGHCMDTGEVMFYLVRSYMREGTLADWINYRRERPLKPMLEPTFTCLWEIAQALDYAHSQGVLHGHLTPTNLFFMGGRLLLADFGIERYLVGSEQAAQMRASLTTREYLAPEQVQGRTEMASDRYSLARLAYQLLCQPASEQLDPSLPNTCKDILARGLAHNPADRFPSACAFVEELERPLRRWFRWDGGELVRPPYRFRWDGGEPV